MPHTWCNVRDVEGADIKEHFGTVYELVEAARANGTAVFVHCRLTLALALALALALTQSLTRSSCTVVGACRALRACAWRT
jgi:hypothetical protein